MRAKKNGKAHDGRHSSAQVIERLLDANRSNAPYHTPAERCLASSGITSDCC